jgi:PAS domain S-box-containing protein
MSMAEEPAHFSGQHIATEQFPRIVEAVKDYAIFLLDPQGRVSSWNAGAKLLKGYDAEEILGQLQATFYSENDVQAGKPFRLLALARQDGRVEDEGWRIRKGGGRFWADVVITALYDNHGVLQGFAKITRDLTERKRAEEDLRRANQDLEKRVQERTHNLQEANVRLTEKIQELEDFQDVVVGRELRMMALEQEIKRLKTELGKHQ